MDKISLFVSGSPHVHRDDSVKRIMWSVVIALIPAWIVSIIYFGLPAITVTLVSVMCCVLFEYLIQRFLLKGGLTVCDGSAVVTGMLLAFNVPSNLPLWILAIGSLISIGVVKMAFGGLGRNLFNPALAGRVFLLISFPVQMTSFPVPTPVWSFSDAITGPTPLGILKEGLGNGDSVSHLMSEVPSYVEMLLGQMGGSFGEISAIALIIGAVFLLFRRIITWHIPVAFIATAIIFATIFWSISPSHYANPLFHIVTGGMLLGAFFMATDMVTSPTTFWGMIIFGAGCGLLTMIIRFFGAYPEGVSFAILIMNSLVPLINKGFRPGAFSK